MYIRYIRKKRLKILYVIETHTHSDHFSAAAKLASKLGAKIVKSVFALKQGIVNSDSTEFYGISEYLKFNSQTQADIYVNDEDRLDIGTLSLAVIHTPGHTPDSISLLTDDRIFTGDTLLAGQCGRTDMPGGNDEDMYDSIFNKLLKLPTDLLVFPAHDYGGNQNTTIGHERKTNSFIKNMAVLEQMKISRNLPVRKNETVSRVV